jgi:hypothetical protein
MYTLEELVKELKEGLGKSDFNAVQEAARDMARGRRKNR